MLPLPRKTKTALEESLINAIYGFFISSFKIFVYHLVFTWLIFDLFNVKFQYLYSLIAGIITIFPFISPWMLALPPAVELYFFQGKGLKALGLLVIYFVIISYVDGLIMKKYAHTHPYVLGMSIALGLYAFGLIGVVYGPVLVCTSIIVYEFLSKHKF